MKTSYIHRLFLIATFLISCPSIFTESYESRSENVSELDEASFQELMTLSRKHTQEIGWCCQQILQTLCNNKEQYTIADKQKVIDALKSIQILTQEIDLHICSKNTHEALVEIIIFNNALIPFLSHALASQFAEFNLDTLLEKIQKKSNTEIPHETLFTIIEKNDSYLQDLLHEIGKTGLTWYNLLHRTMKEYNVYNNIKKTIPVGLGLIALSTLICKINTNPTATPSNSLTTPSNTFNYWATKLFGGAPTETRIADESNPQITHKVFTFDFINAEGKLEKSYQPQTIFQTVNNKIDALTGSGFATITPLLTFNLPWITNYCFGDVWSWTKNTYRDKLDKIDKTLQGSQSNKNTTQDGFEKVYFQDLVGCQELEALAHQLANFVEHPEYYERSKTESHRGILLYGPPQTGKSNFAKALRTLIQERVGDKKKIGFIDGKSLIDMNFAIEDIFGYASTVAPCILFLDEIDLIGTNREKDSVQTGKLLTCMNGIDISSKQIIVIGATNRKEQLDEALTKDGRFGKEIFLDYPILKHRKEFLLSELSKRAIMLDEEFINHIAQETDGCSYNNLRRIITEAINISVMQRRLVCEKDFEKTLDVEIRKIAIGSRNDSSLQEKQIIAAYQAGKAVVRHLLQTNKSIVKITIEDVTRAIKAKKTGFALSLGEDKSADNEKFASEKNESKIKLGEVFTKTTTNKKDLISDQEVKKECLILLAGHIAQRILLNESYGQCNKHDRADAMQMIYQKISQGENIDDKKRAEALTLKETYEQEIFEMLHNNKEFLTKIFEILTKQITIDRYEWQQLVS